MFTRPPLCAAHKGKCPRTWSVCVVLRRGRYAGFGMNLCARHWRRLGESMTASGWEVVDQAR